MDNAQLGAGSTVAIIGGGQAGGEAATLLRQNRFEGRIVLIGEEPCLPYMRPPLSKAFLAREIAKDALIYKAAAAYENARVEMRLNARVDEIDRQDKRLILNDGATFGYDRLVIATGGRARQLPVPGASSSNILYLRTIADVELLQPLMQAGRRLVIVGGGYVGLEVAAIAVKLYDRGPIFFRQERVGRDGQLFPVYKLRTMVPNAEDMLPELREESRNEMLAFFD